MTDDEFDTYQRAARAYGCDLTKDDRRLTLSSPKGTLHVDVLRAVPFRMAMLNQMIASLKRAALQHV